MSRAAQKARMDAYVVAEIRADPFGYALAELRRIDRECAQATEDFLKNSRETREAIAAVVETAR